MFYGYYILMVIDVQNLSSDVSALHQVIIGLVIENSDLLADNNGLIIENIGLFTRATDLVTENESLKEQLALLKAKRFGKSSEKLDKQISELELRIAENEAIERKLEEDVCEKQRPKRQKLAEHLPRSDIVLNPDPICPSCGGEDFRKISDDISEVLDYKPSSFRVKRYIRPRFSVH